MSDERHAPQNTGFSPGKSELASSGAQPICPVYHHEPQPPVTKCTPTSEVPQDQAPQTQATTVYCFCSCLFMVHLLVTEMHIPGSFPTQMNGVQRLQCLEALRQLCDVQVSVQGFHVELLHHKLHFHFHYLFSSHNIIPYKHHFLNDTHTVYQSS